MPKHRNVNRVRCNNENSFGHIHFRIVRRNFVRPCYLAYDPTLRIEFMFLFCSIRSSRLDEAVTYWIQNQFPRTSRARCLVLIGPTGTGKTSFATSLPGEANYFQVRFNLDRWNDHARYSIYDDIPWDEFEKRNCPDKISLLTQQSRPIQVSGSPVARIRLFSMLGDG